MGDIKKIDDGGPAFARPGFFHDNSLSNMDCLPEDGMSLRDWFAGQALAGLYACRDLQMGTLHDMAKTNSGEFEECMAKQAYHQADAMIAARKGGA